ncbi:MAG TPA: beta-ketoacyl-[acyl-carrier-protein] synthase family protein, partial [Lacipirellulaceae bacterium]|nr:beta-ketoacyl-[acyl-carrier-protein] synthase family protein [Lacipirellulaceae bacterium]
AGGRAGLSTGTDGDCQAALTVAARAALAEAECSGKALGHINAHAAGAVEGDAAEAAALAEAVGPGLAQVPVVAAKSYFGNLGAGGGAVETIASLLAFQHDRLFATLNYETPDPRCALNTTRNGDHSPGQTCLKLSVTPQGQAAAVVLQRVDA